MLGVRWLGCRAVGACARVGAAGPSLLVSGLQADPQLRLSAPTIRWATPPDGRRVAVAQGAASIVLPEGFSPAQQRCTWVEGSTGARIEAVFMRKPLAKALKEFRETLGAGDVSVAYSHRLHRAGETPVR